MASTKNVDRLNPQLFALWLGIASILMMFAGLTSAYIVRQAAGNWLEFSIPGIFYATTIVLLLSSVSLHWSYTSFKKGEEKSYKIGILLAMILGLLFVIGQVVGWQTLTAGGVYLKGNLSGSFFYVLTGAHAAHVLGGIAALLVSVLTAYQLKFSNGEKRRRRFEILVHYWHFVDLLWIYILIFLHLVK